jgi:hypothetical protein
VSVGNGRLDGKWVCQFGLPNGVKSLMRRSHTIEVVRYVEPGQDAEQGCVWINKEQYFVGILPEVWNFQIGGHQVCQKWLKDRKGRKLEYEDIKHYQYIVAILAETIRLMAEIDATIIEYGGWPII